MQRIMDSHFRHPPQFWFGNKTVLRGCDKNRNITFLLVLFEYGYSIDITDTATSVVFKLLFMRHQKDVAVHITCRQHERDLVSPVTKRCKHFYQSIRAGLF